MKSYEHRTKFGYNNSWRFLEAKQGAFENQKVSKMLNKNKLV